jgi:hypothetical protein
MTLAEVLREAVAELTYKPGWKFEVEELPGLSPNAKLLVLNISAEATCVDSGGPISISKSIPVTSGGLSLPYAVADRVFVDAFISSTIQEMERHEFQEWLKFGGKRRYYPRHD